MLAEAAKLDRLTHVEIRCDARNLPSAAIPKRLGFVLAATLPDAGVVAGESRVELQVWTRGLRRE